MRAEYAEVIEVIGASQGVSFNDLTYSAGETVASKIEAGGGGIYYFLNRATAEQYALNYGDKMETPESVIKEWQEASDKWNSRLVATTK